MHWGDDLVGDKQNIFDEDSEIQNRNCFYIMNIFLTKIYLIDIVWF